jgi:hypothetical protein
MVHAERALTTLDIEMRLDHDEDDQSSSKNSSYLNGDEGSSSHGTSTGSRSGATDEDVESIKNHLTKRESEAVFRLRITVLVVLVLGRSQRATKRKKSRRLCVGWVRSWVFLCFCVCSFCLDIQPRWEFP